MEGAESVESNPLTSDEETEAQEHGQSAPGGIGSKKGSGHLMWSWVLWRQLQALSQVLGWASGALACPGSRSWDADSLPPSRRSCHRPIWGKACGCSEREEETHGRPEDGRLGLEVSPLAGGSGLTCWVPEGRTGAIEWKR